MKVNHTPIAAAVAIVLMSTAATSFAQEAKKDQAVETVIVTGIRASLQQSINQKKNNESLVEVITAEDVGKMPDKNVADSLQRVPGVSTTSAGSVEGSFGENEHVQLRSLPVSLTLTTLNGHTVSTGDWYGPNIANGGRSVTFTVLPSDLIGRVVVHKSSQADLPEGGAAGTVDIETRHPLDFKQTFSAVGTLEAARSSNAKKTDPSISALANYRNEAGTFGILGQVFQQTRNISRAGSEGLWWDKTPSSYTPLPGKDISYLSGAVLFEQERVRQGGYIEAQIKPVNAFTLNVSAFYSGLDAKNHNTNYMVDLVNPVNGKGWSGIPYAPTGTPVVNNGTITSIFFGPNTFGSVPTDKDGPFSAVEDVAARPDARIYSQFFNFDTKIIVSDDLTVTTKAGYTEGGGHTKDVGFEVWSGWNQGAGYTVSPDGVFILNVPGGNKWTRTGQGIGGWGSLSDSKDSEYYGQADAVWKLSFDAVPSIKAGIRYTDHHRTFQSIGNTQLPGSTNENLVPASAEETYPAGWYGNLPVNPTPGFLPFKISNSFVDKWVNDYFTFPASNHVRTAEYDIKEKTTAIYALANLAPTDKISGNVGLRAVRTEQSVAAYPVSSSSAYTNLLPSLNLRVDIGNGIVLRGAANRGLSRPDFGNWAGVDLRDQQHTGSGGNPYVKPVRANNLDFSAEWYFAPKSLLSAGVFYSRLQGVITYGSVSIPYPNASKPGNPIENYVVATPTNGTGKVSGLEFQYQQGFGGGFGVDLNATFANGHREDQVGTTSDPALKAAGTYDNSLYGTSKTVFNIGAYFENDVLSARLAYSKRSTYNAGHFGAHDYFQKGTGSLNFALNVNLSPAAAFTFEAQNLTDPLSVIYEDSALQKVHGVYKAGKFLFAGVRLKY